MSKLSTAAAAMPPSATPPPYQLFVGVDIAAQSFTVALLNAPPTAQPQPSQTFQQIPKDFANFQKLLTARAIAPAQLLVVMEATSTYWLKLAVFCTKPASA